MSKAGAYIIVVLLLSAAVRLPGLSFPSEVVFDEVHFGKFVTAYCCSHERIFDIHPPHGKLLIAGAAYLGGYRGGFDFEHIGQAYPSEVPIASLRLMTALAGVVLPVILFILLRQLGASAAVALFGGLVAVFDNALVVQSRWISLDTTLLLATFGSLAAFLMGQRRPYKHAIGWYIVAGALAGLAAGVKFTGLAALALVGFIILMRLIRAVWAKNRYQISDIRYLQPQTGSAAKWFSIGVLVLGSAAAIYLAGWAIHFAVLDQPGPGDAWGLPSGAFWTDLVQTHQQMLSANYNLEAGHPDASVWWSWPLMLTSVFYWDGPANAAIYLLGNPVVWWGSTALFVTALAGFVSNLFKRKNLRETRASNYELVRQLADKNYKLWIPLMGFLVAMLPLMRVPRALFLYHYLTPLLFTLMFGLLWIDVRLRTQNKEQRTQYSEHRTQIWRWVLIATLLGFIFFSPLTYGFSVPELWHSFLFLLPGWR